MFDMSEGYKTGVRFSGSAKMINIINVLSFNFKSNKRKDFSSRYIIIIIKNYDSSIHIHAIYFLRQ